MQRTGEGREMELESRPHRSSSINSSASNNATSELFICFASRLSSSSSMKLSSAKSILSPSRPRDAPQISLSSSLSRRLRTNGSMKGGQASPMFPTGGKKRGCAFENPEPSSPKVTCIGQVRVKTKKQGKKLGPNRRRHLSGGEASFRKVEVGTAGLQRLGRQDSNLMSSQLQASDYYGEECVAGRNQRRGHFPAALRTSEWNCFVPCGSSCSTKEEEKGRAGGESKEGSHGGGSCGAVIARWLVALQEGPEGKGRGRKIELVVGDDKQVDDRSGSYRRQAFEGIEFDERGVRGFEGKEGEEEERGRVSICVPPKNALLLMRCRSDPVKMAALVSKFCDTPVQSDDVDEEDAEEVLGKICGIRGLDAIRRCREEGEARDQLATVVRDESVGNTGEAIKGEGQSTTVEEHDEEDEEGVEVNLLAKELHELISSKIEEEIAMDEATREAGVSSGFMPSDGERSERAGQEGAGNGAEERDGEDEVLYECEELNCVLSVHFLSESEDNDKAELKEAEAEVLCLSDEKGSSESEEVVQSETEDRREDETRFRPDHRSQENLEFEVKREAPVLPDCLLLMMCEPKLSMEVSRETWVCRNDFLRWLPERPVANRISSKVAGRDDFKKKTRHHNPSATSATTTTTTPALTSHQERILLQPPRNSCSFPIKTSDRGAAESMATLIEQRLVSAKACEPLVLTRCKSEPMRAAIRLAPDACFSNNRKINPHRRKVVSNNIVKAAKLMV